MSYCFTLQGCFGHFVYLNQNDPHNIEPLPKSKTVKKVECRIAYIALYIQDNLKEYKLLNVMKDVTKIDVENIQFGGAEWFWKRQVNSFVLQVEPERFKYFDKAIIGYEEALKIESIRNQFFINLELIINNLLSIEKNQK